MHARHPETRTCEEGSTPLKRSIDAPSQARKKFAMIFAGKGKQPASSSAMSNNIGHAVRVDAREGITRAALMIHLLNAEHEAHQRVPPPDSGRRPLS